MTWWDKIVKALAAAAGVAAGLYGGFDTMLLVLVAFMAIDYATGVAVAWLGRSNKTKTGHLDSKVGFAGVCRKCLMLLFVLMAAMLDRALGTDAPIFRSMVIWFYIANEGLSILENLAVAGVPFPRQFRQALEQLRSRNDEPDAPEEKKDASE